MVDGRRGAYTVHNFSRLLELRRALRRYVLNRDGRRCQYCGGRPAMRQLTLDHRLPLARGGTDSAGNLWVACHACNHQKGLRTEEEYRAGLRLPRAFNNKVLPFRRRALSAQQSQVI